MSNASDTPPPEPPEIEPPSEALAQGIGNGALDDADANGGPAHPPFPDDGQVARTLRKIDRLLGLGEQGALFFLLMAVVLTASIQAVSSKAMGKSLLWSFDVIRAGTFSIAMLGAAFAAHQQRHLAMDLVSRRLRPRGRLVLALFLGLFTIFIAMMLGRAGLALHEILGTLDTSDLIPPKVTEMMIPISAALVVVHTAMFMMIDVEYLIRGKLPPERARSAH